MNQYTRNGGQKKGVSDDSGRGPESLNLIHRSNVLHDKGSRIKGERLKGLEYIKVNMDKACVSLAKRRKVITELKKRGYGSEAVALARCSSYLCFRHYTRVNEVRLIKADFCRKHHLCVMCASRRAGKAAFKYWEKHRSFSQCSNTYFLTLTVKDGDDLKERLNLVRESFGLMVKAGKVARSRGNKSALSNVKGGVWSIEIKRGERSGLWHPHIHALLLVDGEVNRNEIIESWARLVGQDLEVTVKAHTDYGRNMEGFCKRLFVDTDDFDVSVLEIFKYAVEIASMDEIDMVDTWEMVKGERLLRPFGCMWGLKIDSINELDDVLENERIWIDYIYGLVSGYYRLVRKRERGQVDDMRENVNKSEREKRLFNECFKTIGKAWYES